MILETMLFLLQLERNTKQGKVKNSPKEGLSIALPILVTTVFVGFMMILYFK